MINKFRNQVNKSFLSQRWTCHPECLATVGCIEGKDRMCFLATCMKALCFDKLSMTVKSNK